MSTVTVSIQCPVEDCDREFEIECDYEPADPDVGIMRGGPNPSDDVPIACDDCGTAFTPEQIAALRKDVRQQCADWQRPDDGPDYDPMDAYDRSERR